MSSWASKLFAHVSCVRIEVLEWLPTYRWKEVLVPDIIAGITVFIFVIASSPAYAHLAGLPAAYGLYTSTLPVLVYGMLGGGRHASLGPSAITSLFLGSACAKFGYAEGSDDYIQIALNITMISGIMAYLIGICRCGRLVNILGPTVLSAVLIAAAMITVLSEIKHLFGLQLPSSLTYNFEKILWILQNLRSTNVYSLVIGLGSCTVLYAVKHWRQKYKPTPERTAKRAYRWLRIASNGAGVVVYIVGAVAGYVLRGPSGKPPFAIVGAVPAGLQVPSFRLVTAFDTLLQLLPVSFTTLLVYYTVHWSAALRYAVINGYVLDADQDLMAVGLSNIFGTLLVNSFPCGAGLARTALSAESGAVTQMSQFVAAVLTLLALFVLAPLFYYVPQASLAAVVITSITSMIDFKDMVRAYRTDKRDFVVIMVTFFVTFFVSVVEGIVTGILLSLVFVLKTSAFPEITTLGNIPGTTHFKDVAWYPECEQIPGVAIVRMYATLYFANCAHFKEFVHDAALGLLHTSSQPIRYVVLDVSAWVDVDIAALDTLSDIHAELLSFHVQLAFAHVKHNVHERLLKIKFIEKIGGESFVFSSIADAVNARRARAKSIGSEKAATVAIRAEQVRSELYVETVRCGDGLQVKDEVEACACSAPAMVPEEWSSRGSPVTSPLGHAMASGSPDGREDLVAAAAAGGAPTGSSTAL